MKRGGGNGIGLCTDNNSSRRLYLGGVVFFYFIFVYFI